MGYNLQVAPTIGSSALSTLTHLEKRRLERLFGMESGYVLDFSNRTFEEFVLDVVGKGIYDEKYDYSSGSKANRLRAFWSVEPDHVVARLLSALIQVARDEGCSAESAEQAREIARRLEANAPVADIEAIESIGGGRDFEAVVEDVRKSIERNEPERGLDRLHTFTTKYLRELCSRRGIDTPRSKPIHSLLGELLKALRREGAVESEMAERIFKSTISILDAFNEVRNNRSLAHDNELLSHAEALLIFNGVASAIRFLASVEGQPPKLRETETEAETEEPPF